MTVRNRDELTLSRRPRDVDLAETRGKNDQPAYPLPSALFDDLQHL